MFCKYPCHLSVETPALSVAPEPENRGKRLAPPAAKQTDKQESWEDRPQAGTASLASLWSPDGQSQRSRKGQRTNTCRSNEATHVAVCVRDARPPDDTDGSLETPCRPALAGVQSVTTSPGDGVRKQVQRPPREAWKDTPLGRAVCGTPELHRRTALPAERPLGARPQGSSRDVCAPVHACACALGGVGGTPGACTCGVNPRTSP